jgi:hypothetical protein
VGLCLAPTLGLRARATAVARIPGIRVCLHVTEKSEDDTKGPHLTDTVPTANNVKYEYTTCWSRILWLLERM